MRDIPRWLEGYIQKDSYSCPDKECMLPFDFKGVTGIGIKDETTPNRLKNSYLFIEYMCPKCDMRTIIQLHQMSLIEFATMVMDDFEDIIAEELEEEKQKKVPKRDPKVPRAKKRSKGSKISREEMKKAKDIINNSATWEDFLGQIGADEDSLTNRDSQYDIEDNIDED